MIPKIIHCCWFGGPKTELARKCRDSWERFAPDWEIREWNEGNVSELKDLPGWKFFETAIGAKKWAMASDWLRMAALWKEGGVYLDYDVELVRPLASTDGEWVASEWTASGGVWMNPGSGMSLEIGSPIARGMLESYGKLPFDPNRDMMPWINAQLERQCAAAKAAGTPLKILSPEVLSPIDNGGHLHRTEKTIGIHHYALSWGGPWRKSLQWISWHGGRGLVDFAVRIKHGLRSLARVVARRMPT